MRILAFLILLAAPVGSIAQIWEDRQVFGPEGAAETLRIISSTDTSFFAPIISDYITTYPDTAVEYLVTSTAELDAAFRSSPAQYDVVISSAMDLQLKLANDGFAARLSDIDHPDWAQWRESLFAFTSEPAAIVVNTSALGALPVPNTRQELIELMRAHPDTFAGKIGTYDVRQSGLGYLFATQDARASETFWRLMEVMGSMDAQLYCCSGEMIRDLRSGQLLVAYNVLGSYALAQAQTVSDDGQTLAVILPSEFPTTMMRTALVSQQTAQLQSAANFVTHLIALQSAGDPANFPLPPLSAAPETAGQTTISLNPALMTYLDALKRGTFIKEWENAILQGE